MPIVGAIVSLAIAFTAAFTGSYKVIQHFNSSQNQTESVLSAHDQNQELSTEKIVSPSPLVTPSPVAEIPTVMITLTPTLVPTILPTATPTPLPRREYSSQEISQFIDKYAGIYSIDVNVLRHVAYCESGMNQFAENGPYVGIFQFGTSAWFSARARMDEKAELDLRYDAEENIKTAAFLLKEGNTSLWPNCIP